MRSICIGRIGNSDGIGICGGVYIGNWVLSGTDCSTRAKNDTVLGCEGILLLKVGREEGGEDSRLLLIIVVWPQFLLDKSILRAS